QVVVTLTAFVLAAALTACNKASNEHASNSANANSSSPSIAQGGARGGDPATFAVAEPERYSMLVQLGQPSDGTAGSSVASPSANRNAAPGAPQSNSRNTTSRNTTSGSASSGKVSTEQIKSANKPVPGARPRPVNPVTVAQNQFQLDKLGSDRRW